jgi:glycosyltransferase involved in cell wall biosynthesis
MRKLDKRSVAGVDYFIANSTEVQQRIKKYYQRSSEVIFPAVQTDRLRPTGITKKGDYYLVVGRQIPYKRIDLAIAACNKLRKKLIVIGTGTEHDALSRMAGPTVDMLSGIDDQQIVTYFQRAKGFIFPAEEDFGIVPIEAMAAGTAVIAYSKGGSRDYMTPKTGVTFARQSVSSLMQAMQKFESHKFKRQQLMDHAHSFSEDRFIEQLQDFVTKKYSHKQK